MSTSRLKNAFLVKLTISRITSNVRTTFVVLILICILLYNWTPKVMSTINIEKWDEAKDGPLNETNMKRKLEKQGFHHTMYTFSPGTDFPDHTHSISKKDAILTGRFQFGMFGQTVVLEPGDMVEVPKHTVHNACVVGREKVVFFDASK